MKGLVGIDTPTQPNNQKKEPEQKRFKNREKKDPIFFLKNCLRQEGISLGDRIWKKIEKTVEANWKWWID